jgi:glyoxylase-like metal-dependent hydrolase (beta-lactamase superfamily II)
MLPFAAMTIPTDLVRLTELDAAWAVTGAGARLAAVRRAGRALRDRILAGGAARCVRTADLATFPYPTKYGLAGVARSPAPYLFMRNRMQLVQVDANGRVVTILVNPTDPERSAAAPYFARLEAKYGRTARRMLSTMHQTIASALAAWGIASEAIDYVTYDHLHVQDARGLLAPGPGGRAFLPNAKLLAQRTELDVFAGGLHPLQVEWYIPQCLDGVPADRIVALDGDYAIGGGFALVRTPGHTHGNHSLVVVTDRGAWTISENGICVDAYAPGTSHIRGVARHARDAGVEVILNANTRDGTLDQYTSMVLEKTLADAVPDRPELPQHFASSELVPHVLAPGLAPTYTHGAITHGDVVNAVVTEQRSAAG